MSGSQRSLVTGDAHWRIREDETGPYPAELRHRLVEGIPAAIPGCVHQALLSAGLIPDPFYGMNAEELGWIEQLHWILEMPLEFSAGGGEQPVELILDGVDTYADVFLNGGKVGATENAFLEYRFPASLQAERGENRLRLEFRTIKEGVGPNPKVYNCAFYNTDRVHVRRMQCTFGWDWVHSFVTFGLSASPRLSNLPRIDFPGVLTIAVDNSSAEVEARWEGNAAGGDAEVGIYSPGGKFLARKVVPIASGKAGFRINSPELWNPAGYGAQPLYTASFQILQAGRRIGEPIVRPFGVRTVELLSAFDAAGSEEESMTRELADYLGCKPSRGREFGFRVNGTDVFCLGGNWVPCDPFPGPETEARKVRILRQLALGGGKTIREWGGGMYETPACYDTCAELGILVLQDFMMACADYPADDPKFMAVIGPEIEQAVLRLRGHSAIIHWYGDNENAMNDGEIAPGKPWYEIFEKFTRPALERHDSGRSFTPSCPFFGTPSFDALQGDSHMSVFFTEDRSFLLGDMKDYKERLDKMVGRFGSEYALYGAPDVESLVRFMPEDRLGDAELWEYHTKDNPSKPPGVTITLFGGLEASAEKILGTFRDGQDRLAKLAYIHYEAVRLAVEAYRRKQPFCRGILFWMLNDCWPASGWSMIDYYGRPKAGFHGFRLASQPFHCSFRFKEGLLEAWVSNNAPETTDGVLQVWFERWDGTRLPLGAVEANLAQGVSQCFLKLDISSVSNLSEGVFVAANRGEELGWYFHGMPSDINPPATLIKVTSVTESDGSITCQITADSYARVVTLRGNAIADVNYFDLRAGETKVVKLHWPDGTPRSPLFFQPWNGAAIPIKI